MPRGHQKWADPLGARQETGHPPVLTKCCTTAASLGIPLLASLQSRLWTESERGRVGEMDRGAPKSELLRKQNCPTAWSSPGALVLTSRSPCAARGDAPVNHPTPASSSPCGPCFRGLTLFSPTYYLGRPAIHPSKLLTHTAWAREARLPNLWLVISSGRVPAAIGDKRVAKSGGLIRGSMRIGGDARIARRRTGG
jgi:hypothetical protein